MQFKNVALWVTSIFLSVSLMAAPQQFFNAPKKLYTVAITQFADTSTLNEAHAGIIAGLKERGYSEGKNLRIISTNAKGDFQVIKTLAQDIVKSKPDLIMSISTPATQAVIAADSNAKIPVVFSTVTDPVMANIVPTLTHSGGFVTGVYDIPPIQQQIAMIREMMPNLKNLGVVYNPNEPNSVRVLGALKKEAKSLNIMTAEVKSVNDISAAVNSLMGKVDAIYTTSDSTVESAIESLLKITMENRIPVFSSDHGSVRFGALASIADNQYEVGYLAGRMAAAVLGGKDPGQMDVVRIPNSTLFINTATAQKLNITIPKSLMDKAATIVE
ncbi:MAG: ABC transporter substrate-binding protein [Gammaproteobacteria bacterium]